MSWPEERFRYSNELLQGHTFDGFSLWESLAPASKTKTEGDLCGQSVKDQEVGEAIPNLRQKTAMDSERWMTFLMGLREVADRKGWGLGSSEYEVLHAFYSQYWTHLQRFADADQDERISQEEFIAAWDDLSQKVEVRIDSLPTWMAEFMAAVFDAFDDNNDGLASLDEYERFLLVHGVEQPEVAASSFARLDLDGEALFPNAKCYRAWPSSF
jgi:hypothetical protein